MPNHSSFKTVDNLIYITKTMIRKDPSLLVIVFVGALAAVGIDFAVLSIPKVVIEAITQQRPMMELSLQILGLGALILVMRIIESTGERYRWIRFDLVRMDLILEKAVKTSTMHYAALDDPAILDQAQLAQNALENYEGVLGLMNRVYFITIDLVRMAVASVLLATVNPILILLVLVLGLTHFIFFNRNIEKDKKQTWNKLSPLFRKIAYFNDITSDFTPAKDIRLQSMGQLLSQKQKEIHQEAHRYVFLSKRLWASFGLFTNLINGLMELGMYIILVMDYRAGHLTIAEFPLYIGIVYAFFTALSGFLYGLAHTHRCSLYTSDYRRFMALRWEDPKPTHSISDIKHQRFEFDSVCFRYPNQNDDVLHDFSLVIEGKSKLAIVGMNGAGKSTLIKLLLRLVDPTQGRILVDGIDIRSFDRQAYQSLFAPLFQDVHILAMSVAQNVAMTTESQIDRSKVEISLDKAGLLSKIQALEMGIETPMLKMFDENGLMLSGGESQKLSMARALYKDAPVLVLDEPTSALDALAEHELYQNFNAILQNKTAIYISHRLASTRFCDAIALISEGRLEEYGSHTELMEAGKTYRMLFDLQAVYYQEEADHDE